jgi:endonuclease/exonuclease/phosphatase (EEP) superfamily protein YafD
MSAPPDELPGRTRPPVRRARLVLAVLLVLLVAVVVLPDLLGLDHRSPFAQLVSFRPAMLAGLLVLAVAASVAAVVRRRGWTLAGGLLAVAAVGGAMVLPRAIPAIDVPDPDAPAARTLTVLSFNTYEGDGDVDTLAALIRSTRPDLIALPEAGGRYRDRLAPLVPEYRFATSNERGRDVQNVAAAVHSDLASPEPGDVTAQVDRSTPFPSVEVSGAGLGDVRFVAFHSIAPVPGDVPQWRSDLSTLDRWCGQPGLVIIAGDFNATLDHSVFRSAITGCADAAEQAGAGLEGTWNTRWPRWLGPQIDHVLVTGGITAETLSVLDVPGSDHRAVLTRLRLPT